MLIITRSNAGFAFVLLPQMQFVSLFKKKSMLIGSLKVYNNLTKK